MTITFYNNSSPANYVKKSLVPGVSLEGYLRGPSSVIDPVVIIEIQNVSGANYAYITEFGRFYFITNWVQESTGRWRCEMHCDVLSTWWSKGLNQSNIIASRNSYRRQDDLVDDMMYFTADSLYGIYEFPNKPFAQAVGRNYIVMLAGAD